MNRWLVFGGIQNLLSSITVNPSICPTIVGHYEATNYRPEHGLLPETLCIVGSENRSSAR